MVETQAPLDDIARVEASEVRFQAAIAGLTDDDVRRPSPLPGWTVADVLTHVARNADSHRRRAEGALHGEVVDQYQGGPAGRAAEIEAGATRSAAELLADVRESAAAMLDAWRGVPDPAWAAISRDVSGKERPLADLPGRRWQETEVHLVDLGIGVTHRQWSDAFVDVWLPRVRAVMERSMPGGELPAVSGLDSRDELAWLYGRLARPDLPTLPSWG